MGLTAQAQQSRAEFDDGKWYWVEHDGWIGQPSIVAPACYKAECDAWYSHVFSGISTRFLKVLEPCERQAARALPATSSVSNAGNGALPQVVRPLAKIENGSLRWHIPASDYSVDVKRLTGRHYLFTADQVQTMLAQGMEHACNLWVDPESLQYVVDSCDHPCAELIPAYIAAAPRPPAAPSCATCNDWGRIGGRADDGGDLCPDCTRPPAAQERKPLTDEQIALCAWGYFEDHKNLPDFAEPFARAIEAAHGIGATP